MKFSYTILIFYTAILSSFFIGYLSQLNMWIDILFISAISAVSVLSVYQNTEKLGEI